VIVFYLERNTAFLCFQYPADCFARSAIHGDWGHKNAAQNPALHGYMPFGRDLVSTAQMSEMENCWVMLTIFGLTSFLQPSFARGTPEANTILAFGAASLARVGRWLK